MITELINKLKTGDEEERLNAVGALKIYGEEGLPHIAEAIGDESWRVRKAVVEAFLECHGNKAIYPFLIKALYDDENAGRRNTSCEILTKIGLPAVEFIVHELKSSEKDVRKFIVDILGGICHRSLVPYLEDAIHDYDENVSSAAVESLGKIGSEEAYSCLLDCLEVKKPLLQFTALEAIGELKKKIPENIIKSLIKDPLLKRALFDAFGKIGNVEYLPYLFEGAFEKVKNIRESSMLAVKRICSKLPDEEVSPYMEILINLRKEKGFLPDMLSGLKSLSLDIVRATLFFLGLLKEPATACEIARYLSNDETRNEAYKALVTIGGDGVDELVGCYEDHEDSVKSLLVLLFGRIGDKRIENILLAGLKSNWGHLRANSAKALAHLGFIQHLDRIANLLGDKYSDVQQAAIDAIKLLAEQDRKIVTPYIHGMLAGTEDVNKKTNIIRVIGEIATEEDVEIIENALKDQDPQVRKAALKAVKNLGIPSLVESSIYLLSDENPQVRIEVIKLLGSFKKGEYVPQLVISLKDEDIWVRIASIKSLADIGCDECLKAVAAQLEENEPIIILNSLEVLEHNRHEQVIPSILKLLSNPDNEISNKALNILFNYDYRFSPDEIEAFYSSLSSDAKAELLSRLAFTIDSSYLGTLSKLSEAENNPEIKERLDCFISSFKEEK